MQWMVLPIFWTMAKTACDPPTVLRSSPERAAAWVPGLQER
jgi:hypothetical protein